MSSKKSREQKKRGGLHIFFRSGDSVTITHNGEQLTIYCDGRHGSDQFNFSLVGPRSFEVGKIRESKPKDSP